MRLRATRDGRGIRLRRQTRLRFPSAFKLLHCSVHDGPRILPTSPVTSSALAFPVVLIPAMTIAPSTGSI